MANSIAVELPKAGLKAKQQEILLTLLLLRERCGRAGHALPCPFALLPRVGKPARGLERFAVRGGPRLGCDPGDDRLARSSTAHRHPACFHRLVNVFIVPQCPEQRRLSTFRARQRSRLQIIREQGIERRDIMVLDRGLPTVFERTDGRGRRPSALRKIKGRLKCAWAFPGLRGRLPDDWFVRFDRAHWLYIERAAARFDRPDRLFLGRAFPRSGRGGRAPWLRLRCLRHGRLHARRLRRRRCWRLLLRLWRRLFRRRR